MTESDLLTRILGILTPYGVCVLHGYQGFPNQIPSDVDAVVTPKALRQIKQVLQSDQIALVQHLQHESTAHYYVFSAWNGLKPVFIRFDVSTDFRMDGRVFFSGEEFLQRLVPYKGFMVPPADLEFAYYMIKKITKVKLEDRHVQRLGELWRQDPEGCSKQVARFFDKPTLELFAQAVERGNWSAVEDRLNQLREELLHKTARLNPWLVAQYWLADTWRKLRRVLNPTGLVVAVLGADGSGKSTLLKQVQADLAPAFRRFRRYHLRPMLGRGENLVENVPNPHDESPRSTLVSVAKLGIWFLDYWLGFLFKVWPKTVQSALVIFDRYYYDLLVDPYRYRFKEPMNLARAIQHLIPKPHLVILLDAAPEVLHSRKQELPLEELQRQQETYRQLVAAMPNGHVVDASRSPDEVSKAVEQIILDFMAQRTARRLGL